MKKALIIGGSNGIGLAIGKNLIDKNYKLVICDLKKPKEGILPEDSYTFQYFNMLDYDYVAIDELSKNKSIKLLMITAGIGRVADLEYLHPGEIHNLITIDLDSTLRILRSFYDRINSDEDFYTGVMGSIAGWISSPMFSVYAAAKAGVCRFVESVNVELEMKGRKNRILNVSPGSIKGTRFNGGQNDLSQTKGLAEEIVGHILSRGTLFIPQYDEVYKGVIEQYQKDPHEYGIHSYEYKKSSGRATNEKKARIGYLSGTFDLFHVGHLNLLRRAKEQCDYLIVGVHYGGAWKGKETFIPLDERKAIIGACKYVDQVVDAPDEDDEAWNTYHYNMLFVGSDYKGTERFNRYEEEFAGRVQIVYFPYTKGTSSTQIRAAIVAAANNK
jgi:glycerol-3-phosphate cytidylyltransferase